jgi:hypothetical protein
MPVVSMHRGVSSGPVVGRRGVLAYADAAEGGAVNGAPYAADRPGIKSTLPADMFAS